MKRNKIKLFEEFVDKDVFKSLKLDTIKKDMMDDKYFFTEKVIGDVYDAHIFEVLVDKIIFDPKGFVVIHLLVTFNFKDYSILLIYANNEDIYYGSKIVGDVDVFREKMGKENMEFFDDLTQTIIDDHIPSDFWEVHEKSN